MDVSRVEAVSPKQIDWRKLTSQEIIKYDAQGVDVPSEYLQWAKEFRADINAHDKDDTTYEMASANIYVTTETKVTDNDNTSSTADTTDTESKQTQSIEDSAPLTAKEKRQQMNDDGDGLYEIGQAFIETSTENIDVSNQSIDTLKGIETKSTNEIETLDSHMKEILSDIDTTMSKIEKEKNKNDKNSGTEITKLKRQLKQLGVSGQTIAAQIGSDFNQYDITINEQLGIGDNTIDYGNETIDIGNELEQMGRSPWLAGYRKLGRKAEKTGQKAVEKGNSNVQAQGQTLSLNTANIDKVNEYTNTLEERSGVSASEVKSEANNSNSDKKSKDNSANTAQTQTETDKAASGNLDQILQSKIRKGEQIET